MTEPKRTIAARSWALFWLVLASLLFLIALIGLLSGSLLPWQRGDFAILGIVALMLYDVNRRDAADRTPAPAPTVDDERRADVIAYLEREFTFDRSPLGFEYTDQQVADILRRSR